MGTSTRLRGPQGPLWKSAARRLTSLVEAQGKPSEERAAESAEKFLLALADTLQTNPDAFGLRKAAYDSGQRLIDLLETLKSEGAGALTVPTGTADYDLEQFEAAFVQQIAGSGGLIVDAAVRQAAMLCAQRLLNEESFVAEVLHSGEATRSGTISADLFCELYRLFFSDIVTAFLKTLIAEKVKLAFPVLALIDRIVPVAESIADTVVDQLPNPCDSKDDDKQEDSALTSLAHNLLMDTVQRALRIPGDGKSVA